MSEEEFNKIFSKRLNYFLSKYSMSQADLAKRLGVGTTGAFLVHGRHEKTGSPHKYGIPGHLYSAGEVLII